MIMNELAGRTATLRGLNNINLIMGRNGSGKSRFLRDIESVLGGGNNEFQVRYVSPERAGSFKRDGNVMTNMSNDPNWIRYSRSMNQVNDFKSSSAMLFRDAETNYLRRLEEDLSIRDDHSRTFSNDRLSRINRLLTNISLEKASGDYEFRSLVDNSTIPPNQISSGESEAVALASEIIYFFDTLNAAKMNVLLLDEPDVHLHPDLQARLAKLILSMFEEFEDQRERIAVCITTHSTSFVSALADSNYVSLGTKSFGVDTVELGLANEELRKAAPFFGHPLSLALSQDAPLILEGEDDERVWQQAARTSRGSIKIFPVLAGSVDQQEELEVFCGNLLNTLYDHPVAFSLRDGDGAEEVLEHRMPVRRFRLRCYAIENAIVTDPCLAIMNKTWNDLVTDATHWLENNVDHRDVTIVQDLIGADDRLRGIRIKKIRQLICSILNCGKPWEVVVGQAIGALNPEDLENDNMLVDYLGADMLREVVFQELE